MDRSRLEAFSDGVIAVAITLLALDLTVAGPGHGKLAHQLGEHWPAFLAYLISFFTIGIIWVNHHAVFDRLRPCQVTEAHHPPTRAHGLKGQNHSTVTLLARLRGLSTSQPRATAM